MQTQTDIERLSLPGRAGRLKAAGARAGLVAELGDNYADYHQHLAKELKRLGPLEPHRFDHIDDYLKSAATSQRILRGEAMLRNCRRHRREGTPVEAPLDMDVPLVDEQGRLVSVITGKP